MVELDLKDLRNQNRVTEALKEVALSFNWWVAWVPKGECISSKSVEAHGKES